MTEHRGDAPTGAIGRPGEILRRECLDQLDEALVFGLRQLHGLVVLEWWDLLDGNGGRLHGSLLGKLRNGDGGKGLR